MIYETHAHLDDKKFDSDRVELLSNIWKSGVKTLVNVGASMESTMASLALAHEYDWIFASVGIHPDNVYSLTEEDFLYLRNASLDEKCAAIGEIGLDYNYFSAIEYRPIQKYWFNRQLELAKERKLPVIIHSRDACDDTFKILKEYKFTSEVPGIIHCFSYSPEIAMEYVKRGWYIGVGGVVTFKNARKLVETVEKIALDSIVLETDCPYLSPVPHRGERNSSLNLQYIAAEIAKIKGVSVEEVEEITYRNAIKIYGKQG